MYSLNIKCPHLIFPLSTASKKTSSGALRCGLCKEGSVPKRDGKRRKGKDEVTSWWGTAQGEVRVGKEGAERETREGRAEATRGETNTKEIKNGETSDGAAGEKLIEVSGRIGRQGESSRRGTQGETRSIEWSPPGRLLSGEKGDPGETERGGWRGSIGRKDREGKRPGSRRKTLKEENPSRIFVGGEPRQIRESKGRERGEEGTRTPKGGARKREARGPYREAKETERYGNRQGATKDQGPLVEGESERGPATDGEEGGSGGGDWESATSSPREKEGGKRRNCRKERGPTPKGGKAPGGQNWERMDGASSDYRRLGHPPV
ncbi:hypothetical protein GOBAR_AA24185 [Gossypium barbadense]|uniref:Uncharacterized protein n=1 Tax=Gossypium barbadense TaxID=3634 RepID=A0A2P5WZH0_GOSBA|nr:hypothetical protein GOBAR_AA24185 [Gossypium barbadense]